MRGLPAVYESDGSLLLLTLLLTILKLFRRSGMDGETVALICGRPARRVFCSESSRDADKGPSAPGGGGRDAGADVDETADMGTDIACAEEDEDDGLCGGTVLLGVKLAHEGESVSDERTLGSELAGDGCEDGETGADDCQTERGITPDEATPAADTEGSRKPEMYIGLGDTGLERARLDTMDGEDGRPPCAECKRVGDGMTGAGFDDRFSPCAFSDAPSWAVGIVAADLEDCL